MKRNGVRALSFRAVAVLLAVTASAPAMSVAAGDPGAPPPGVSRAQAARVETLVERAAAQIARRGVRAFPGFRVRGSRWYTGHTYVFVDSLEMVSLVNPPRPQLEGRSVLDLKDASGRAFHRDWLKLLETADSGWTSYLWPRPGHAAPTLKWTFIRKVAGPEGTYVVGSGTYGTE